MNYNVINKDNNIYNIEVIKLSNGNKYALFSGKYNHFLDFELVNYGFTEKWIYSIHPITFILVMAGIGVPVLCRLTI